MHIEHQKNTEIDVSMPLVPIDANGQPMLKTDGSVQLPTIDGEVPRIYIGVLCPGVGQAVMMHEKFFGLAVKLIAECPFPKKFGYCVRTVPHTGDNTLAESAIQWGATHLLILDDDTTYVPQGLLERLIAHNKDVISPFVNNRKFSFNGNCQIIYNRPEETWRRKGEREFDVKYLAFSEGAGAVRCGLVPTNFLLIKTKIFETKEEGQRRLDAFVPTPETPESKPPKGKIPFPWFHYPMKGGLQDTYFCALCAEQDVEVWADVAAYAEHDCINPYNVHQHVAFHEFAKMRNVFMPVAGEMRNFRGWHPKPGRAEEHDSFYETEHDRLGAMPKEAAVEWLRVLQKDYRFSEPPPEHTTEFDRIRKMQIGAASYAKQGQTFDELGKPATKIDIGADGNSPEPLVPNKEPT